MLYTLSVNKVMVSALLCQINHVYEAPLDAYLIYNMTGGIYYVNVKDFPNFTIEWIGVTKPPSLTMDLASARTHSIILDLDFQPQAKVLANMFEIIETVLKMTFLPTISHFTYIIATRSNSKGIHVHLPEFQIAHDDYILLCEILQHKFRQALTGFDCYKLDILVNATLPAAAKPNTPPYVPIYLVYVDERCTCKFNMTRFKEDFANLKKTFARRKHNENSLFRSLLKLNCYAMLLSEIKHLLMPVVDARTDVPIYTPFYGTSIGIEPNSCSDRRDVASFSYKRTGEPGYICKSKKLEFSGASTLQVYHHLKLNACNMTGFVTGNHALKRWFERFDRVSEMDGAHIPAFFRTLHTTLQFEHMCLAEDPNPIKTILQYKDGYYFLPAFYALCRHYRTPAEQMVDQLRDLLDVAFHPLLEKLASPVHSQNVEFAMAGMSLNTLHFCANNLHEHQPLTNRDKLESIVNNNRRALLSVTNLEQMAQLLRDLQDRHLPIYVLKLRNALKKPARFVWNALSESWQEVSSEREISDHIQNLWIHVKQYCLQYKKSGGPGGPGEDLLQKFNIATVVSTILSDTAMERKDIQMDAHKWFLRLEDGVLDLLTGHIGGVVPEFFLSDRKIQLGIPRPRMWTLCNDSPALERLYARLVEKSFFQTYLQALFLNRAPTLMDALRLTLAEDFPHSDPLVPSMLHFYVNLCKCTSFEYDLVLYMLDVLASVMIGTNYMRKFFVWKGLTRNGKSKLFELMSKVFGGYYHSIQSENLSPGHSANNATPELASTLFSCRMVTTEELEKRLDENRVKQITGNSFVTFRNMYEQNSGGIPTAKIFATTNNYPECKASEAFKDRVRAIPFEAEFADEAPTTTLEQLVQNVYEKNAYVVEESYRGCFFMLYYHLKRHMSPEDGLLHYRREPACVLEFTRDYLYHADIYVQFKLYMDVQLRAGSQTTQNDVKSAVRQYLKTSKNTSFHESDLFMSFEKEFGHLRQTDVQISGERFSYMEEQEEDGGEPSSKRRKVDTSALIFYDGLVIKNLRRQNLDD